MFLSLTALHSAPTTTTYCDNQRKTTTTYCDNQRKKTTNHISQDKKVNFFKPRYALDYASWTFEWEKIAAMHPNGP